MNIFLLLRLGLFLIVFVQTDGEKVSRGERRSHGFSHQRFSYLSHSPDSPRGTKYHEEKRHFWEYKSGGGQDFFDEDFNPKMGRKREFSIRRNGKGHKFKENSVFDTQTPVGVIEGRTWVNTPEWAPLDDILNENTPTSDPVNASKLLWLDEVTPEVLKTDAIFSGVNGSVVKAQVGTTANISCVVLNRDDHETVSWMRLRDHHLITVGRQTYSSDERFSVSYNRHSSEWILHLRFVQRRDAGEYVCQVSTHPPMVFIKTLSITEASATIEGGPERIVEGGSVVKLNCSLRHHSQRPEWVFWYHNRTMINFDTNRQVKVENTEDGSILTLKPASLKDSGNYTCVPSKAQQASIMLHVILDDAPEAMQVSGAPSLPFHVIHMLLRVTSLFLSLL